jgi:hypothetical protein
VLHWKAEIRELFICFRDNIEAQAKKVSFLTPPTEEEPFVSFV